MAATAEEQSSEKDDGCQYMEREHDGHAVLRFAGAASGRPMLAFRDNRMRAAIVKCVSKYSATRNVATIIHGNVVIATVPGPSVNTRYGVPGAERNASVRATTRSSAANAFQTARSRGCRMMVFGPVWAHWRGTLGGVNPSVETIGLAHLQCSSLFLFFLVRKTRSVWALWKTAVCAVFQVPCGRVLCVHRDGSVHTVFHCASFGNNGEARKSFGA
jgi:hypothetical protein